MNARLFNMVDLIAVPVVLSVILVFLYYLRKKQPVELQQFFFKSFFLRALGTITIAVVFEFIYGYGDTYGYYYITQGISFFFKKDFSAWLEIIFSKTTDNSESVQACHSLIEEFNTTAALIFQITNNVTICKIASVVNIICFNSYLAIALVFGMLSFLGCWFIFKTFVHIFPGHEKQYAWLCLYLPSLWFWGNGILKDPLCIFALGILLYSVFVKKGTLLRRLILICLGTYLLLTIKAYIFYSFAVALSGAWWLSYVKKLNTIYKMAISVLIAVVIAATFSTISEAITEGFIDIVKQSQDFLDSYTAGAESEDATLLPTFDPSPIGFLKLSAQGLIGVYLRPFPWELRKILYLFVISENLLLYYIIFRQIKTGPVNFKKNAPTIINFSLIFVVFMGIVIGVTSFNAGTIARYRVPALPFLFAGVFSLKMIKRKKRLEKMELSGASEPKDFCSKSLSG